ncbi:MAG: hypothetical protein FWF02_09685 [Micrococcales bacterium]|nr:hypothetical protein [Micrococcales bacterium]MCL2667959.1 hypothetical protein [Micrococcales bacterium]
MMRRFNVSARMRAAIIVPVIVAVIAGAYVYIGWGAFTKWRAAQANSAAVHALDTFRDVALAIRAEQVTDPVTEPEARAKAVAVTDGTVRDFKKAVSDVDMGGLPQQSGDRLKRLVNPDTGIDYLLADARRLAEAESPKTSSAYLWVMVDTQAFVRSLATLTPDRDLAQWLFAYDDLFSYTMAVSAEARAGRSLIGSVERCLQGDTEVVSPYYRNVFVVENEYTEVVRTATVRSLVDLPGKARLDRDVLNLNNVALTEDQQHPERVADVPLTLLMARSDLRDDAKIAAVTVPLQAGGPPDLPTMDEWNGLTSVWFAQISAVEATLLDGASNAASDTARQALVTETITVVTLVVALLLVALLAWTVRPAAQDASTTSGVRSKRSGSPSGVNTTET